MSVKMWSVRLDTLAGLTGHLPPGTIHIAQSCLRDPVDGSLYSGSGPVFIKGLSQSLCLNLMHLYGHLSLSLFVNMSPGVYHSLYLSRSQQT